ncbi:MAG: tetratricopeptide repeat protein, partial [Acidobacteria bacterium]|nr:tetratricopeptide repeat protein [Acidobacteriota bacterium]
GTVKILDFGIVKWLEQEEQTQTLILTPRYSAPEQILAEPITTATDIFTLGLLLVECITECHPFDDVHSVFELQKAIVSRELTAPSKRLAKFPVDPISGKAVRGDLDAICLKAVQIEPKKRYQSALQMAMDLQNWVLGLPVSARPVGKMGRSLKWVRRNPSMSAVLCLLFGSWLFATLYILKSNQQIAAERQVAILERDRAATIASFLENLFEQNSPEATLGKNPSALDLLENGKRLIGTSLDPESEERTQLLHSLCKVYFKLGQDQEALGLSDQALPKLKGEVLAEHYLLRSEIFLNLGRYPESQKNSQAGLELAQEFRNVNLQALCYNLLGECYSKQGQHEQAGHLFAKASPFLDQIPAASRLAIISNQAIHAANIKNYALCLESSLQVLGLKKELFPEDHPQIGLSHIQLGNAYRWVQDPESSKQHFEIGLSILNKVYPKGHGELASAENDYAGLLRSIGQYPEARQHYEIAMKWLAEYYGEDHPHTIMAKSNLGVFLLSGFEDFDGAIALFEWSFQHAQKVLPPEHQFLGEIRNNLAIAYERRGDLRSAQIHFEGCVAHYRAISGETPHPNLSAALCELGNFYSRTQKVEAALAVTREALTLRQKYGFGDAEMIYAYQCLGQALLLAQKYPEALDCLTESASLLSNHAALKWEAANQGRLTAEYEAGLKNWDRVQEILQVSLPDMEKFIGSKHPNTLKARALLASARAHLALKDN